MRYPRRASAIVLSLQIAAAVTYSAFIYYQTKLISSFELGVADARYFICTAALFVVYIVLEFTEITSREKIFAAYAKKVKKKAAEAFFRQGSQVYAEKSADQHIAFFSNEVYLAILQHLYLRLYIGKLLSVFLFALLTLTVIAWQASAVIAIMALSFGVIIRIYSKKLAGKQKKLQERKSDFVEYVMEFYHGYEEIHMGQMESAAQQSFSQSNQTVEEAHYKYKNSLLTVEVLGVGQTMMVYIFVLLVGGLLAMKGFVGIGVFISAAELSVLALNQWGAITRIRARIKGAKYVKDRVEDYVGRDNVPFRKIEKGETRTLVKINNVSYHYGNIGVIHNVSFSIARGEKHLIVGASGSGKSTLLEILVGHKSGYDGAVIFYTDCIAYVPQNPFLFSGSLLENLAFDRKDIEEDTIRGFLQKVELDIPLDAMIEEGGKNLSGGQKARVALVRALLSEPELLITDELTANMDTALGQKIEKMLLEEYPDMSLCAVAHRTYYPEQYNAVLDVEKLKRNDSL